MQLIGSIALHFAIKNYNLEPTFDFIQQAMEVPSLQVDTMIVIDSLCAFDLAIFPFDLMAMLQASLQKEDELAHATMGILLKILFKLRSE